MANALKHSLRSSRKYQRNKIPVNMFINNAIKAMEARERREMAKINLETQETVYRNH